MVIGNTRVVRVLGVVEVVRATRGFAGPLRSLGGYSVSLG